MRTSTRFIKLYGKDHIYSKAWRDGFKTKTKQGIVSWHDTDVIEGWMKTYMRTHNKKTGDEWL